MPKRTPEVIIAGNQEIMQANFVLDRFDFTHPVFQPEPGTEETEFAAQRRGVENLLGFLTGQRRGPENDQLLREERHAMYQYISSRVEDGEILTPQLIQESELIEWAMDRTGY